MFTHPLSSRSLKKTRLFSAFFFGCFFLFATAAYAVPDLTITSLKIDKTSPKQAEDVTITVSIINAGTTSATATRTAVVLSTNNTITLSDVLVGYIQVPKLDAKKTFQGTLKVKIPVTAGVGRRWLGALSDDTNRLQESNEGNNIASQQVTIQRGSLPDLTPTAFTISSTSLKQGDKITVTFTIRNGGTAEAPAHQTTIYFSTNTTISTADVVQHNIAIPKIGAGKTYSGKATVTIKGATGSSGAIGIYVDRPNTGRTPPGAVGESNENNNTRYVSVRVQTPDLYVSSFNMTPTQVRVGTTVTATAVITNIGSGSSPVGVLGLYFSQNSSITASDNLAGTTSIPVLGSLKSTTVKVTVKVTATMLRNLRNPFYAGVFADHKNAIAESEERNNTASNLLNRTGPDFTITSFTLSGNSFQRNQEVTVSFTVRNNGTATGAAATAYIVYSRDQYISYADTRLTTVSVPALKVNEQKTYSVKVRVPNVASFGTIRYLGVYADALRRVTEGNEYNNSAGAPFRVAHLDLQALSLNITPNPATKGKSITISIQVRNNGSVSTGTSLATVYATTGSVTSSSPALRSFTIPALKAGATYKTSASVTLPTTLAGTFMYAILRADSNRKVTESNEYNNDLRLLVRFAADVDLQPTAVVPQTKTPKKGQRISVRGTIRNNGTSRATTTYGHIFYSKDNVLDSKDTYLAYMTNVGPLGKRSTTGTGYVTIPNTAATGKGYLILSVDHRNRQTETNEKNNTLAVEITIQGLPDLEAKKVESSVTSPLRGQTIAITVTIANPSIYGTVASYFYLYLSTDATLGSGDRYMARGVIPPIAAKKETKVTVNYRIPTNTAARSYYVFARLDPFNRMQEDNERNNIVSTTINITATRRPDLLVRPASVQPTSVKAGASITVQFSVNNGGTADAKASVAVAYFMTAKTPSTKDVEIKKFTIPAVATGKSSTVQKATYTIPASTKPGTYYVRIQADQTNTNTESNENNNSTVLTVTVVGNDPDNDKDGFPASKDCNDNDKTINPNAKEVCDGKDNNCDKKIDEGNLCPSGSTCSATAKKCVAVEVPPKEQPPKEQPPTEQPPVDAGPVDTPPSDQNQGDCYTNGCPAGQRCRKGKCEADPCDGKTCGSNQFCRDGKCIDSCSGVKCTGGNWCIDGQCVKNPCATVRCGSGTICVNGKCVQDLCKNVTCGIKRVCDKNTGKCVDDPCSDVTCPGQGQACSNGQCTGGTPTPTESTQEASQEPGNEPTQEPGNEPAQEPAQETTNDASAEQPGTPDTSAPEEPQTTDETVEDNTPTDPGTSQPDQAQEDGAGPGTKESSAGEKASTPDTGTQPPADTGCGCSTQSGAPYFSVFVFLLLAGIFRRRRTQ